MLGSHIKKIELSDVSTNTHKENVFPYRVHLIQSTLYAL